ncbi:MAG TPA: glycosyltransferase family 1 protein [Gammaproteobacteria bacterium]|nr:glycosyltransferase family 1 protein [Gammaproteobacteria bacterium]
MTGTRFKLEVQPRIPERLWRLSELANDLFYGWERQVRGLFHRIDPGLWTSCGHNPKVFLRRVAQPLLDEVAEDRLFIEEYNRVLSVYDSYNKEGMRSDTKQYLDPKKDLVAYFCAEFGIYESFPIYSGGLGILAGDHCKAASDLGLPFIAIGLLYRQGYFTQTIDTHGNQIAHYAPMQFDDLPVQPALDNEGQELHVIVEMVDREVILKVWWAKVGHIILYLLDSDLPDNDEQDRFITHQLYGGDSSTRIQQEIVLGIGGVRLLHALNLKPTVWHINEGHAAFQILERCQGRVSQGMDFASALELVAAGTVFTTHTPVPAGHDIFEHEMIEPYFRQYVERLGINMQDFLALGMAGERDGVFNMTALALRGSRFHNGVSRIHGTVASQMESYVWPQIPPEENPISYVTNGVHVQTFLALEWINLFDMRFREWRNQLLNTNYWQCLDKIPAHRFWSLRQELKSMMAEEVTKRVTVQHRRNGVSEAMLHRLTEQISKPDNDILILGFARRFATYKRATLLFSDKERLARLLNNPERPVLIIFAGKAHPLDQPGQQLIKTIYEYAQLPEFIGKIIMVEGYDMALARKLVSGVDVWLNTPEYPMEASGTSGEKAGLNGVINLSVLDGWWGEGYNGKNGWAIAPHGPHFDAQYRDHEEANDLYDILEHQVIPLYYDRGHQGYSENWVNLSRETMKSTIPRFNSQRMVMDYVRYFYTAARDQQKKLTASNGAPSVKLAKWKAHVRECWSAVSVQREDMAAEHMPHGEKVAIRVGAFLNGLSPEDVVVELLVGTEDENREFKVATHYQLRVEARKDSQKSHHFRLDFLPELPGLQYYKIRMYPYHELLSRRFETGCMIWL